MNFTDIFKKPSAGQYIVVNEEDGKKVAVVESEVGGLLKCLVPSENRRVELLATSDKCIAINLTHELLEAMGYIPHYNEFDYSISHQKVIGDYIVTVYLSTCKVTSIMDQVAVVNFKCTTLHELQNIYDFVGIPTMELCEVACRLNPNDNEFPMYAPGTENEADLRYEQRRAKAKREYNDDVEMGHIAEGVGCEK